MSKFKKFWVLVRNCNRILDEGVSKLEIDEWFEERNVDGDNELTIRDLLHYYIEKYSKGV